MAKKIKLDIQVIHNTAENKGKEFNVHNSPTKKEIEATEYIEPGIKPTKRREIKDGLFHSTNYQDILGKKHFYLQDEKFSNYLFIRAVATDFLFKNIDFSKTIFDSCYLRDCRFINCSFEGAKFTNCNLQGTNFELCNFDYVIFEKTFVDQEVLSCAPTKHNLKYKFARALKLNYASIGDYISASKAVGVEMEATKKHLLKSWLSGEDWYIRKYGGIDKRSRQFIKWAKVSILDFIWGNGESLVRLVRFNIIIFTILTFVEVFKSNNKYGFFEFIETLFIKIPSKYFGLKVTNISEFPEWLELSLIVTRLICFGLLMSIIIKKYNRR